jgi:mono/diheme cytochrome c family protein
MPREALRAGRRAAVLMVAAVGLSTGAIAGNLASGQDFSKIDRGRYLTIVGDCVACHTNPGAGRPFAGGRPIETPFGIVASPNITPDRETGIGSWSAQAFDDALRQGKRADGKRLYPAMPFPYYTKMSRKDVDAIRTYLSTIEPVHNQVEVNRLPFPFRIRAAMRLWDALYFDAGDFKPDASKPAQWNRGAYLVQGPGHCGACHTPKGWLGGDHDSQALQGYSLQGWFAPNITNDNTRGLGHWSAEDVIEYLKKGHNQYSGASGPMSEEIVHSSSRMSDADLSAIATYLKDEAGQKESEHALAANDPQMKAGKAIYQDLCAACHRQDGTGSPYLIPNLAHSTTVASREPTSLLRVVLRGAQTVATRDEPTGPSMPAFGWQLDDEQVAAVTTYLRNSWGHAASAVSSGAVHEARKTLKARAD